MTLAEVLPAVRQLTAPEKLKLIRILAEELDQDEARALSEPGKVYHLPGETNLLEKEGSFRCRPCWFLFRGGELGAGVAGAWS